MGDLAECDDGGEIGQALDACLEEGAAGVDFGRERLVLRGRAAHGVGDVDAACEAELFEGFEEQRA